MFEENQQVELTEDVYLYGFTSLEAGTVVTFVTYTSSMMNQAIGRHVELDWEFEVFANQIKEI